MGRTASIGEVDSFIRAGVAGHTLDYYTADTPGDCLASVLHMGGSRDLRNVVNRLRSLANDGWVDFVQQRAGHRIVYRAIWRERQVPLSTFWRFEMAA